METNLKPTTIQTSSHILIIGGGLAGLTGAIDLRLRGYEVLLIEKKEFPFHKVCGEYVSNEVRPYLESLGSFPAELGPKSIHRFALSAPSGNLAVCKMKLGGFGVSRFAFDNFLFERGKAVGVKFMLNTTVKEVDFKNGEFIVGINNGETLTARVVIGAFGKRSVLDKKLGRGFYKRRTDYVGVKHHFKADFPDDLVALHNFDEGYCGLSRVENDSVNLCFLTTTHVFKKYKTIAELEQRHLSRNPHLNQFFKNSEEVYAPLVISQVNFSPKKAVENHVLMSGDSAGLIHPMCGNGMAMAIHSAKICAQVVEGFLSGKLSREEMEITYSRSWTEVFHRRLVFGRNMERLFGRNSITEMAVGTAKASPSLLSQVVKLSHGKQLNGTMNYYSTQ